MNYSSKYIINTYLNKYPIRAGRYPQLAESCRACTSLPWLATNFRGFLFQDWLSHFLFIKADLTDAILATVASILPHVNHSVCLETALVHASVVNVGKLSSTNMVLSLLLDDTLPKQVTKAPSNAPLTQGTRRTAERVCLLCQNGTRCTVGGCWIKGRPPTEEENPACLYQTSVDAEMAMHCYLYTSMRPLAYGTYHRSSCGVCKSRHLLGAAVAAWDFLRRPNWRPL